MFNMKGSFTKRGRQCDVTVTKTHLTCTLKNNLGPNVMREISLSDILAVQTQARDNSEVNSVVVHYADNKKNGRLTWEKLILSGQPELCKELSSIFAFALPERQRSRHYLVVINPYAGKKKGARHFHKLVAPLFRACGITFRVYITAGPHDVRTAFQDLDFSTIDGVIAVGGDGFYSEVVTAAVLKQQQILPNGVNVDDPDANLTALPFPIGIIPIGSGNFVIKYLQGIVDPVSAAIKIVLARTTPTNIVSIHQGGKLCGYSGLISSFGLLGEMMNACEKYRWMGQVRYKVIPLKSMFSRRLIDAGVEFMKESTGEWHTVRGSFYNIDSFVVDLADKDDKLVPVFADTALTLHMTTACSLGDHVKQLTKVQDYKTGAFDYEFVQNERVSRYCVTLDTLPTVQSDDDTPNLVDNLYMNLDGDPILMNKTKFHVRLHPGTVQLFG